LNSSIFSSSSRRRGHGRKPKEEPGSRSDGFQRFYLNTETGTVALRRGESWGEKKSGGRTDGWTDGRMDRWTDGWTDGWKEGKEECGCLTRAPMGAFGYPWPSSASPDMRCCRCWKGDAGGPGTPGHPRPILTGLGCPEGSPDLAARPRGRRLGPADAAARL